MGWSLRERKPERLGGNKEKRYTETESERKAEARRQGDFRAAVGTVHCARGAWTCGVRSRPRLRAIALTCCTPGTSPALAKCH